MFENNPNLNKILKENEIKHVFQVLHYINSWQEFLDVSNMIKQNEIFDIHHDGEIYNHNTEDSDKEENEEENEEDIEDHEDIEDNEDPEEEDYIEKNKKMKIDYLFNMINLSNNQIYPLEYNRFKKGIQVSFFLFVCPKNISLRILPYLLLYFLCFSKTFLDDIYLKQFKKI
jgi:hypothetical protein